jgi:protein SCO1/2
MRSIVYTTSAALLGLAALWAATDGARAITAEGARRVAVADNPRPVPRFPVETMHGTWEEPGAAGPTLVEFIYTTCPTICQVSGGDFAELRDHLADQGLSVPMYSISFDPEQDDTEAMQTYAELHTATGDPWTVARPKMEDLSTVLRSFDVTVIPDNWGGYEHNIAVLLIDGQGRFAGAFDTRAFDQIAAAVKGAL